MSNKKNRRRAAAPQAKGYSEAGASLTRRALKGFVPDSGAPNEDINRNNATLRQRARMLYMAAPVATAAINTNRTKVIGTGLTLKASVDREVLGISPEAAKKWQHFSLSFVTRTPLLTAPWDMTAHMMSTSSARP